MKTLISAFSIVICLGASGMAYAECPDSLSYEVMLDCIVVEGAGDEFDIQAALEYEAMEQKVMAEKQLATATSE